MKKILIAIDNSPTAESVAEHGFKLCQLLQAESALLSVADMRLMMTTGNVSPNEMAEIIKLDFRKFHQILIDKYSYDKPIFSFIEKGNPYEMILETAKNWNADLIVMGTHGRTGLSHLLMGSVAEKVIRHTEIQVLVIPTK